MRREGGFNIFSLLWAVLFHILILLLALFVYIDRPEVQAESGVSVMLGMGNLATDYDYTEITPTPAPAPAPVPAPVAPKAEPIVTQNLEETVAIESGQEVQKAVPVETPREPTPEEIRAEQERKAAETAQNLMANAFGRSNSMQQSVQSESAPDAQGTPGSETGNSTQGKLTGEGSYGTWDLGGRGMIGELPRPAYNGIQDEGRVVVTITVNPSGKVIDTRINNRTNTTNLQLRNAAEEAARKTQFNEISGENNQSGTITYYFKLK